MIIVVGRGYIGSRICHFLEKEGKEFFPVSHESAFLAISTMRPDSVINCAAVTGRKNIDDCEKNKKETIEGNAIFPVSLHAVCNSVKARLYHFSSGCVYMGNNNYKEEDEPNFTDTVYIASKLAAESALKEDAVILRIRMPFDASSHPKNLLCKLSHYAKSGYLVDSVNSISSANDAALACIALEKKRAPFGIYHVTNDGSISTKEIVNKLGIKGKWMDWESFYLSGNGPKSQCTLSNKKLSSFYEMRNIHDAIEQASRLFREAA